MATRNFEEGYFLLEGDYYLIGKAVEGTFAKLKISPTADVNGKKNIFAKDSGNIFQYATKNAKNGATQRQGNVSLQQTSGQKAILTLKTTDTQSGTKVNNKVSIVFPYGTSVIWVTHVLGKYMTDMNILKSFKGLATWKRGGSGARFAIGKVPKAVLDASVQEYLTAVEKGKKTKATRHAIEVEPIVPAT